MKDVDYSQCIDRETTEDYLFHIHFLHSCAGVWRLTNSKFPANDMEAVRAAVEDCGNFFDFFKKPDLICRRARRFREHYSDLWHCQKGPLSIKHSLRIW